MIWLALAGSTKRRFQWRAAVFTNQGGLATVGQWRVAIAITDPHLGQLKCRAQRRGIWPAWPPIAVRMAKQV